MADRRKQLLDTLLRKLEGGATPPRIPRRPDGGHAPLSFSQERLWFLDQYNPGTALYNIPLSFPLPGAVDPELVRVALNRVVQRHESLRTSFQIVEGRPVQVVAPKLALDVPFVDLSGLPEAERQNRASAMFEREGGRPFDLSRGPLLRATVIRLRFDVHCLFLFMHHIVSDAWSSEVLMREFHTIYARLAQGLPVHLPELPIQYPDFALWQRTEMTGPKLAEQLSYWKQHIDGAPAELKLPRDRPRPPSLTFRGSCVSFLLPAHVTEQVQRLCHESGVTPFMVLLACFKALLHRYTDERSIVVGIPSANRTSTEIEGLIGFFVNSLVLHTRLSPELTFRELLGRVRGVTLDAYAHQELPFEKLVEELQPSRSLNMNPIFQVMFDFQRLAPGIADGGPMSPAGATAESESFEIGRVPSTGTSKFDLSLPMLLNGNRIGGVIEYSTDLFDEETIFGMARHFRTLIEAALANLDTPIGRLPLMAADERAKVLQEWNRPATRLAPESCAHALFEEHARRTPDRIAVVHGERTITYAELDRRAEGIARTLRARGVAPERLVGLCMEDPVETIASALGALKAGGAFFYLDPGQPDERFAKILAQTSAQVVLTERDLLDRARNAGAREAIAIDASAPVGAGEAHVTCLGEASNACCVVFASDASGLPKGVIVTHGAMVDLAQAARVQLDVGPDKRLLSLHPCATESEIRHLFEALLNGATLCLAEAHDVDEEAELGRLLRRSGITHATLPARIADSLGDTEISGLSIQAAAGDPWGTPRTSGRTVNFGFEAAECALVSSWIACTAPTDHLPLGRALPHLRHYVVDQNLEPCVIGRPGELLVGGRGLARGYLARPGLTAARFVPDPFSGEPGARLFRTGACVRWRRNGTMEYLGRLDRQVTVRGHRVDLGEIDLALRTCPSVSAAAAMCRALPSGALQIVAYVEGSGEVDEDGLRERLSHKLPREMIPETFVFLEKLPVARGGEVDRAALPAPETVALQRKYVAPRTPLEQVLAGVWAEVLGVERVGVHDNFFELGGHSLLVTQIISRLRDLLHVDVPVHRVFEEPTVEELAQSLSSDPETGERVRATAALLVQVNAMDEEALERMLASEAGAAASPPADRIQRRAGGSAAPLSFGQERLWFLDQFQPGSNAYNTYIPFPVQGRANLVALERSVNFVIARHEVLRTVFPVRDGSPVQVVAPELSIVLGSHDLRDLPASARALRSGELISQLVDPPFDLARGPLLRAMALLLEPERSILVLAMHHIISDAWSRQILSREILSAYEAFRAGRTASLPELPVQYADFAIWQRRQMQGARLARLSAFWKDYLADAPPVLQLPTDRPRPPVDSYRAALEPFAFPPELSKQLEDLGRAENATMFMVLLSAFSVLLHRHGGDQRIVVGAPASLRGRAELEGLVGFFTNTLALKADLTGEPTFRELLRRLRDATLAAYDHQDLPFERLVETLNPERLLNVHPIVQVMLVTQRQSGMAFQPPADEEGPVSPPQTAAAKFELILYLDETEHGLKGGLEYATELFDRETAQRMIRHLRRILEAAVERPDLQLSRIDLLEPEELRQLTSEWSGSTAPSPFQSVLEMFRRQATATPDACALIDGAQRLSYRELQSAADRLAARLSAAGVTRETRVASFLERGRDALVAVLSVLEAGAAHVPVDPSFPPERITRMLRTASLVLVSPETAARLPPGGAQRVLPVGASDDEPRTSAATPVAVAPENLAYVIHTSGSTGIPRAVGVTHRTLGGLVAWQRARSSTPPARTLQYSSASFDVSLQEIFSTWCAGGTLVSVPEDVRRDAHLLFRFLGELGIERLFLPYVALRQLAEVARNAEEGELAALRLREIITAGEQLRIDPPLRALMTRLPGCRLYNQYGPSETHVVTEEPMEGLAQGWLQLPPIGVPVAGARIYILDVGRGHPTPVGVPGELCIGGDLLARGYLDRPGATAERFVPDPFGERPGARMYRTGDRARFRSDGRLEFLGRFDDQVKIHGFRVEPGEVEATLSQLPDVAAAAVAPRLRNDFVELTAYLVARAGSTPSASDVRAELLARLPSYMVPSQIVFVPVLPLTATGKLDRRRLPTPDAAPVGVERPYVAPRSDLEQQLAGIWSAVLQVPEVGVHDSFFDLGGHSLLATQLISRIQEEFGVRLPLRVVFEAPTIAGLSVAVVHAQIESVADDHAEGILAQIEQLSDADVARLALSAQAGGGRGEQTGG